MSDWLWRLLQLAIIIGVVCWSIYDNAPGSGLAHVIVGIIAAWVLTVLPFWLFGKVRRYWRRRQARILASDQPAHHGADLFGSDR